ncbi:peptidylprolyl isomerase [Ideonella sp. BN130291]|uniref:peptidylprolyl isomerase n=1 Tax=Ideonella sp. BN130291 TaxID=3112940 RepID=UPI002E260105|nr:peptidylprolyl isomerase [Ideonella sp. BN130291]
MTELVSLSRRLARRWLPLLLAAATLSQGSAWAQQRGPRGGDYIVAVVNQELVTAGEVDQRVGRIRDTAQRTNAKLPSDRELRQQVLEALIEERVLITYARETGTRVDDADVDRAVQGVAQQNQLTLPQLRERLRQEGMDYARFRNSLRDQMLVERVREREVLSRIKVSDPEIDDFIKKQRGANAAQPEYNIAQILVTVPDGASVEVVAERQARARVAQQRVRDGEDFAEVAKQMSEDGNRQRGGEIGPKPADRLPDVFVAAVRDLKPGQVAPTLLRTGAGFHVLKLLDRKDTGGGMSVTQTRARHILLRPSAQLSQDTAVKRLAEMKRQIASGRRFEELARQHSEDGSAAQGGDLGWVSPGALVPEFEEAMNRLPNGGVSDPVVSRFGVHLIQVLERRDVAVDPKQLREQARNALREQKFDEAYNDWIRDLRAKAYVEMREPPQ